MSPNDGKTRNSSNVGNNNNNSNSALGLNTDLLELLKIEE